MSKISRGFLWGLLLIVLMFVAACSPKAKPVPTAGQGAGEAGAASEQVLETQPAGVSGDTGNAAAQKTPQVPEDVPVMDGAYKLQVARAGAYVIFQVDGSIDDVVTFYEAELPNYGWHKVSSPDTITGSTASILRENEAGDKLNLYMQRNDLGDFVSITIAVQRTP